MKKYIHYSLIVVICFLYTGSAYMSQFYRLMELCDPVTVDIISSGWNYLLQAAGMALFSFGLYRRPDIFGKRSTFAILLATGAVFMSISQVSGDLTAVAVSGYIFNLHIGLYFGYYLAMFAVNVPPRASGICYGASYALASVGTFLFSLIDGGAFLTSVYMMAVYLVLAAAVMVLVLKADDICPAGLSGSQEIRSRELFLRSKDRKTAGLLQAAAAVLMTVISVLGSGLYYSLPQAENVNWYMIRAFYALGLVLAGGFMDKSRAAGAYLTAASLTYPLIAGALIGDGFTNTLALGASYACRGFVSVYYITAFTDIAAKRPGLEHLAPAGLFVSRLVESLLSVLLMSVSVPAGLQLIISAACFLPLLLILFRLFSVREADKKAEPVHSEADPSRRLAAFSQSFGLTRRESEILGLMAEGLTDDEISSRCYISKNTVRFHVSNILKKTGTSGRMEAVRSFVVSNHQNHQ